MNLRLMGLALLTVLSLLGTTASTRADGVDDYLKAQMTARHIPGLSVAVVQDGKVVKAQGYGLANVELSVPATADTVYPIGSLSKQFTAVGIMLLVQAGKVSLDAPLHKYLTSLPVAWRNITVRELLNQTSGIPEWGPDLSKDPLLKIYSLAEIAWNAAVKPLAFTPGTKFEYSNTNYNLLAGIIEQVSGKAYGDFLQQNLFQPLSMNTAGIDNPQAIVENRCTGYDRIQGGVYNNVFFYHPSYYSGSGNLEAAVGDLVKWDAGIAEGKILPLSVMAQMWTPPVLPGSAETDYGMGWMSETVKGHRVIWHNGAIPGCMGFAGRFPDDHLTVIVLSNMFPMDGFDDAPPFFSLGMGVAKLYLPDLAKEDAGIPDTDPQTAALLKTVSAQTAAGTLDKSLFTSKMQLVLTPEAIKPAHDMLAALPPLSSLTLLRRDPDGRSLYKAMYGMTVVNWLIAVDKGHKITLLIPQPQ